MKTNSIVERKRKKKHFLFFYPFACRIGAEGEKKFWSFSSILKLKLVSIYWFFLHKFYIFGTSNYKFTHVGIFRIVEVIGSCHGREI